MICVSLTEATLEDCLRALERLPFAEIRMDLIHLSLDEVASLFSRHKRLIATCRPGELADDERKAHLLTAMDSGAAYVDVEVESKSAYREEIVERARSCGCQVIVSFHDYEKTPERPQLETILSECFSAGADIAKIACTIRSERENARLLGLLDDDRKIMVIGIGAKGSITRVVAPLLGSPFTFASLAKGKETADGQIDRERLLGLIQALQFGKQPGIGS